MRNSSEKIAIYLNESLDNLYPLNRLRYGVELFLSQFILVLSMLIISFATHTTKQVVEFMIFLILIRTFCGGYHSDTYLKCFFITNGICFISIFIGITYNNSILYKIISILSYLIILIIPLLTKSTAMTHKNKTNYILGIIFSTTFLVNQYINLFPNSLTKNIQALVLLAVAISLLLELVMNNKIESN
ncbi:MAG: accessory gene regulator B family protein [Erysipelotrichaceae bacterium]